MGIGIVKKIRADILNSQNLISGKRLIKKPQSHSRDEFGRKMEHNTSILKILLLVYL